MCSKILTLAIFALVETAHDINNTDAPSDVIVTFTNHAEANPEIPKPDIKMIPTYATETTLFDNKGSESVVFVPNDKVFASDYNGDRVNSDLRKLAVLGTAGNPQDEQPSKDFLFLSGKNTENHEKPKETHNNKTEMNRSEKEKAPPLDCSNLDCNNTLKTVCGVKMENGNRKYRVFLNECYFRKVNCGFKYEINRYVVKPDQFCKTVGAHVKSERRFVYNPRLPILRETSTVADVIRRSFASRRSLNVKIDGSFCSHSCPSSCPESYDPECAMTSLGQHHVFVNHCKLDYNSCLHGTVWHRRPLSECVGSEKADLKQNRAFIGWMQRIGIVDGKGKLLMD